MKIKNYLKGSLRSWTIWFNTTGAALLILAEQNHQLWKGYFDNPNMLLFIIMGVNVALRVKTNKALHDK